MFNVPSWQAPPSQSLGIFTSVIVICSLGALAVTVQAKVCKIMHPNSDTDPFYDT